jgi:hypothetical protein
MSWEVGAIQPNVSTYEKRPALIPSFY